MHRLPTTACWSILMPIFDCADYSGLDRISWSMTAYVQMNRLTYMYMADYSLAVYMSKMASFPRCCERIAIFLSY